MKYLVYLLLLVCSFSGCVRKGCTNPYATNYDPKAKEEDCSCISEVNTLEGTYTFTIVEYPRDPFQVGHEYEMMVFHANLYCNAENDFNSVNQIKVRELFIFGNDDCHQFYFKDGSFEVTLADNVQWEYVPIIGKGTFKNGGFTFKGSIFTSAGEFPIRLEGNFLKKQTRTTACSL